MPEHVLTRRHALIAAAFLPGWAHAQGIGQTTPAIPPALNPLTPTPAVPAPPHPPPPPVPAIDKTKAYYVYFDQTIDVASMRALRRQLATLVEAGVVDITIVLHSLGGLIDPTLTTYSFIRALPATINTHATGFIASAANLLFLAGAQRSADRNTRFLFHPSVFTIGGSVTGQQLQDRVAQSAASTGEMAEIYHDRTSLTDSEIERFTREEIIYSAPQARDAGIIQTVADLRIPGEGKARIVFLD